MDIALTENGDDLDLSANRVKLTSGDMAVAQHLRIRLRFFAGEWFLDARLGIPYWREVYIKAPNRELLQNLFRRVVEETPGVLSVPDLQLDLDAKNRSLSVAFTAILDTGATLEFAPFDLGV